MRRWLALSAALACAACAVPIGQLEELALEPGPPPTLELERVEGRDCRWWVLGLPLGLPRIDAALRAALEPRAARALRDVEVISEHPAWGPVGKHCYAVRGTAWR